MIGIHRAGHPLGPSEGFQWRAIRFRRIARWSPVAVACRARTARLSVGRAPEQVLDELRAFLHVARARELQSMRVEKESLNRFGRGSGEFCDITIDHHSLVTVKRFLGITERVLGITERGLATAKLYSNNIFTLSV